MHGPWLEPWWLERQLDPDSPDYLPGGVRTNVTHRRWAPLGTLAAPDRGVVDPRGAVTPWPGAWSLDWWIGADDRWHLPSREVAVRQRSVEGSPVVETAMRVPGGDAVHRAWAATAGGRPWLVVEVENATSVPFAVAFAVRPANPLGDVAIGEVAVDEHAIGVDGRPAVWLSRRPSRVAVGSAAAGDALHVVTAGLALAELPAQATCPEGRAHAVVIHPLPHTAAVRVAMPLSASLGASPGGLRTPRRRRRATGGPAPGSEAFPSGLAPADQVVKGWALQTGRGARFDLPDEAMAGALDAARHQLLLAHDGEDLSSWSEGSLPLTGAVAVLGALDRLGFHEESGQVLATLGERQRFDGRFGGRGAAPIDPGVDVAADGAALHALGEHCRLSGQVEGFEALVGPIAKAGHRIAKRTAGRRGPGLAAAPEAATWWVLRGLLDGASVLEALDQPEAAAELAVTAGAVRAVAVEGARRSTSGADSGALLVGVLDLVGPEGSDDALVEGLAAAVERLRAVTDKGAVLDLAGQAGLDPRATLWLATVELAAGDRRALDRLAWVLDAASPAGTWPTVVHPRTGGGSAGDGADPVVAAEVATFVRRLLVREVPGGLALCSLVPWSWLGQGWEVHGVPTAHGRLGFAVRWHGERPALLWELEARQPGAAPVRLTAPGLDPSWSSDEPRGEALLAPVVVPTGPEVAPPDPPLEASSSFG